MSEASLQPCIQEVRYHIGAITYERSYRICDQVINTGPLSVDLGSIAQCLFSHLCKMKCSIRTFRTYRGEDVKFLWNALLRKFGKAKATHIARIVDCLSALLN